MSNAWLSPEVVKAHDADEQVDADRDPCLPIEFYTKCQPVSIKRIYVSDRGWAMQKNREDGVRDVEAMGSQELVQHKAMVFMQSWGLRKGGDQAWQCQYGRFIGGSDDM